MKKLLSLLLSFSIIFSLCAPFSALAQTPEMKNPLYESGVVKPLMGGNIIFMSDSRTAKYKGNTYYTLGRQLYRQVKTKLENRKAEFTIRCISKDKISYNTSLRSIIYNCYLGATDDEIARTSTDGDYLRWSVSSLKVLSFSDDTKQDGYYFYTVKAHFVYYDTVAQEKETDRAVDAYISSLNTNGKSDYQIIKEVHDYICRKNTYSYVAADSPEDYPYAFSAYGTLIKGKSVCQGYAAAFYRICRELGYSVRFVSSDPDRGCHAWNIVALDGKYYIVDCTWDDQAFDESDFEASPYYYFLTDYDSSMKYDSYYAEHKLYSSIYDTSYFEKNYKSRFAASPYNDENLLRLSSCSVSLSSNTFTYNGKSIIPTVTVKDNGVLLKQGTDYSLTYVSNVNAGIARVNITGKGRYVNTSTHRVFKIIPPASSGLKVTKTDTNAVNLSWSKAAGGVTGYQVQYYYDGKWQNAGWVTGTSCTVKTLSPAKKYTFRVRAYKTVYNHSRYGAFSPVKVSATKPKKEVIKSVTAGKKRFTVKWKKLASSGYQLQYSEKKNMKESKKLNVKANKKSKTVKKLKAGKKYFVRVRAYKKYTDENGRVHFTYGKWSAKKSVIIKKS